MADIIFVDIQSSMQKQEVAQQVPAPAAPAGNRRRRRGAGQPQANAQPQPVVAYEYAHAYTDMRLIASKLDTVLQDGAASDLKGVVEDIEDALGVAAQASNWQAEPWVSDDNESDKKLLAAIYGILSSDGRFGTGPMRPADDNPRWMTWITQALSEYNTHKERGLTDAVLEALTQGLNNARIKAGEWMSVTRTLATRGIKFDDIHLGLLVGDALTQASGVTSGIEATAAREISLPNLEQDTDLELQVDNIKATQAVYFCAMLDEMRLFDVVDKLVEHFQNGLLPLGRGPGGELLYKYWRNSVQRLTGLERRGMYSRCFGMLTGTPGETANTQFDSLSLRFISAVSEYFRQNQIGNFFQAPNIGKTVFGVSQEAVRKSARDLASNLSLHGYGITFFAGSELMSQVNDALAILRDQDIKSAYGARDQWQVVEQVNALDFGTPKNTYRFRTTAHSGAVIIRWLANNATRLTGSLAKVFDEKSIINGVPSATNVLESPTDYDLVNACEQWLAVNGVPDTKVEEYSQPIESPLISSRPINLPDISQTVNDALAGAGVPMSMNARNARMNGSNGRARSNGAAGAFARY